MLGMVGFLLMAVVAVKSAGITARDAFNNFDGFKKASRPIEATAIVDVTNGDSIASTYVFFSVPSWAKMSDLHLLCKGIATTGLMDIGLYDTTENGGAVVDVDFFASAKALTTDILAWSDVLLEANSGPAVPANLEKQIWQLVPGSLTKDPQKYYDVVGTLTEAAGATGKVVLRGRWTES